MSKEDEIRADMARMFDSTNWPSFPRVPTVQETAASLAEKLDRVTGIAGWTGKLSDDGRTAEMRPPPGYTPVYRDDGSWTLGKLSETVSFQSAFTIEDAGPHPKEADPFAEAITAADTEVRKALIATKHQPKDGE